MRMGRSKGGKVEAPVTVDLSLLCNEAAHRGEHCQAAGVDTQTATPHCGIVSGWSLRASTRARSHSMTTRPGYSVAIVR